MNTLVHRRIKAARAVKASHAFSRPGTYFPVLRATSQRQGDLATAFARIQNLDRVRVFVHFPERGIERCPQTQI